MVAVTKLRVKFGPEVTVKTFQTFPGVNSCGTAKRIEHSRIGDDLYKSENHWKKRGPTNEEVDEVQAKKKRKLDCDLSSQCLKLLRLLMKHRLGLMFNEPVDPVKLMIPDYFYVISKPMDLGTIESKLLKNGYSDVDEFAADVRLTFSNAMVYNPPDNPVHGFAKELKKVFESKWGLLKRKSSEVDFSRHRSSETLASSGRFSVELPKETKEKKVVTPVKEQMRKETPTVTEKTLATKLRIKKLDQGLGVNSDVKIPSKGPAPTTACKCASCGRTICICLKSCNSSGSDASSLTDCQVKNTSGSQESESDPYCNGSVSSANEKNGCVSSQHDKSSNSGLLNNELKTSFPVLPPLPPEKALRAAMLKSQYAETIVKAKHKIVLNQSNKSDVIRIQIEKQQMERTQREAKARIEAEMRAAKIATRMRAEAEVKQQRERQRLELEKMKIDYDFEQNNHSKLEKDFVEVCGCYSLTRTRLLFKEWGLVLTSDYCPELEVMKSEIFDATRVDDLEEGEIL